MKPRIKSYRTHWTNRLRWKCSDGNFAMTGETPKDAYLNWVDMKDRIKRSVKLIMSGFKFQ